MNRIALLTLLTLPLLAAGPDWKPLFDGKTLNGWTVCNGKAPYVVEGNMIVGATVEGSPNSFLCTDREYGDFVLEFETKTTAPLNSGVQIRSHRYAQDATGKIFDGKKLVERKFPAGRVYGYQVEVSDDDRGVSGGVYDEARRGWLTRPEPDSKAAKAYKNGDWNHYRIEAYGDHIRVWVNGIQTTGIRDSMDLSGFIGLQVHSFKGPHPTKVYWRNLRIQDLGRHTWKRIWDGQTLNGWKHQGGGIFTVQDGAIYGRTKEGDERAGYVVSDEAWSDLTLRLKFRIPKGNSGVFVRTDPANMASYEVEVDSIRRTGGFWETGPGGRAWVTGPEDNAAVNAEGWSELTAALYGHSITFQVNGYRTLHLPHDPTGRTYGRIALQAHGAKNPTEVWFKDLEVLVPER